MDYIVATVVGSMMLGTLAGYVMGRANGSAQLARYIQGREDEQRRHLDLARGSGGPCWVKGHLPPEADE